MSEEEPRIPSELHGVSSAGTSSPHTGIDSVGIRTCAVTPGLCERPKQSHRQSTHRHFECLEISPTSTKHRAHVPLPVESLLLRSGVEGRLEEALSRLLWPTINDYRYWKRVVSGVHIVDASAVTPCWCAMSCSASSNEIASPEAPFLPVRAPAGPPDGSVAAAAPARSSHASCRSHRTNLLPVRSWLSRGVRWRERVSRHVGWENCHSSRCVRIPRTDGGGTTNRPRTDTLHIPRRLALTQG